MKNIAGLFFAKLVSDILMVVGRFTFSKNEPETQVEDSAFLINLAETLRLKQDLSDQEKDTLKQADAQLIAFRNRVNSSPDFADTAIRVLQTFVSEASEYVASLIQSVKEGDSESASDYASCALYYRAIIEHVRVWSERNDVELGVKHEYGFDDEICAYAPKSAGNDTRVEFSIIAGLYTGDCFLWEKSFLPPGNPDLYASDAESREPATAIAIEDPEETPAPCASEEIIEESFGKFMARIEASLEMTPEEEAEIVQAVANAYVPRVREEDLDKAAFWSDEVDVSAEDETPENTLEVASDEEAFETETEEQVVAPLVAKTPALPGMTIVASPVQSKRGGAHRTRQTAIDKKVREAVLQKAEDAQEPLFDPWETSRNNSAVGGV